MNKIEKIVEMLSDHFNTNNDSANTDRELLIKIRELVNEYVEDNKVKSDTEGAEQAKPSNIYQVKMAKMTPEELATLGVQLVTVNNDQLFWVTSTGQLYPFNQKQNALEAEYSWLMAKPN